MTSFSQEQIKEIAEQLDCGFRCFLNKNNNELMFVPDFDKFTSMDTEFFEEDLEKLDNNFQDYLEIEALTSRDSFQIMAKFVDNIDDTNNIKNKLINALNKKKPFREFNFVIDNSGEYRQQWFDFKNGKLKEWVQDKLDCIKENHADHDL